MLFFFFFFFQAEDGIRDVAVTGVQTCALPIFNGGISIGTTVSRYKGSSRNSPSATSAFRSRWVAASTLTSTGIGPLLPTRSRSEERRVGKEGRSRWSPDH